MDHDHEPEWSDWYVDPEYLPTQIWRRDCQVQGCPWRQMSSEKPGEETPLGKALNKFVGIDDAARTATADWFRGRGITPSKDVFGDDA